LLAAQEGAKEIQKSKAQEATKLVKEKVDQKKKKKGEKSTGKRKGQRITQPKGPKLVIPDYVKEAVKKDRERQRKKSKAKVPTASGMIQVAESVLPELEQYRSHGPILWDPRELKDATVEMGAVREKNEEHVATLTEVVWSQRTQPIQREWIVFQFGVSLIFLLSFLYLLFIDSTRYLS
jgi:hypothetical protein